MSPEPVPSNTCSAGLTLEAQPPLIGTAGPPPPAWPCPHSSPCAPGTAQGGQWGHPFIPSRQEPPIPAPLPPASLSSAVATTEPRLDLLQINQARHAKRTPQCPPWCDPARCIPATPYSEIRHISAGRHRFSCSFDDIEFGLALHQTGDHPPGYLLTARFLATREKTFETVIRDGDLEWFLDARAQLRQVEAEASDVTVPE